MKRDERLQTFLDAATAGLKGDRELQLGVQAELASHVEASLRERSPAPDQDPLPDALRALGPATDVAAELVAANRRRMKLRARLRLAARALLVPAAVALAIVAFLPVANVLRFLQLNANVPLDVTPFMSPFMSILSASDSLPQRALTEQEWLLLHGDPKREGAAQQQRSIWEAAPTNLIYLGNYVTSLAGNYHQIKGTSEAQLATYTHVLSLAERAEPDNARFPYLKAIRLLTDSSSIKPRHEQGASQFDLVLTVTNEARFAQAIEELRIGLGKPYFRRYAAEMMGERLAILGPPQDMVQEIAQLGMLAGQLLPDLSGIRNLARASVLYAERLIEEGRGAEAMPLLTAPEHLAAEMYRDSYCLIDLLVAGAVAGIATNMVPPLHLKRGDPAMAARYLERAERLARPVHDWKAKRKAIENSPAQQAAEDAMRSRGSIMARLLMPALNEYPDPDAYRPGRLIEYALAEKAAAGLLTLALLVAMLGSLLITLRWRFARGGASAPLLLLPDGPETLRILGLGVLLPLLTLYACSSWPVLSGRDYGISYVWPKALLQLTAVVGAIVLLTAALSTRAVRRRCRRLEVAIPQHRFGKVCFGLLAALVVMAAGASLLPSQWLTRESGFAAVLAAWVSGALLAWMGIGAMTAFFVALAGPRPLGLYYGTVARSLIPCLALAVIVLSLLPGIYLRQQERSLFRQDTIIGVDPSGGFTKIEARLVQRLKAEALQAIESMQPPP